MSTIGLACISCLAPLCDNDEKLICSACGTRFERLGRVPVIARGARVQRRRRPEEAFVDDLAAIIAPDLSVPLREELAEIFSQSVLFDSLGLQVEADQFTHRLIHSGCRLAPMYKDDGLIADVAADHPTAADPGPSLVLAPTITPARVRTGCAFSVQVRVANLGGRGVGSTGETPVLLAYCCAALDEPDIPAIEGARTPLLIDLDPGMRITMPVALHAPTRPGRYLFTIAPLQENVRWFMDKAVAFEVDVAAPLANDDDPLVVDWTRGQVLRGYAEDHAAGIELLRTWLSRHVPTPEPVLLELGGNANPMLASLPGTKFNVDIDAFGLAFGELRQRVHGGSVTYIAADGTDLPFADGTLDGVAMFATFHHFPDPVGLLRHLHCKLKPAGLLCLLCEPIGSVFRDNAPADFVRELRRGVNEQSFEPWEYRDMLAQAGYEIVEALIDIGSMKLAARPARKKLVNTSTRKSMEAGLCLHEWHTLAVAGPDEYGLRPFSGENTSYL